jgi:hypothetical protein
MLAVQFVVRTAESLCIVFKNSNVMECGGWMPRVYRWYNILQVPIIHILAMKSGVLFYLKRICCSHKNGKYEYKTIVHQRDTW